MGSNNEEDLHLTSKDVVGKVGLHVTAWAVTVRRDFSSRVRMLLERSGYMQ